MPRINFFITFAHRGLSSGLNHTQPSTWVTLRLYHHLGLELVRVFQCCLTDEGDLGTFVKLHFLIKVGNFPSYVVP